jgi:hypothetical protein
MQYPPPGYNFAPAYQTSGLPFLTSSTAAAGTAVKIEFPYVTKDITIGATGGATTFAFTANGLVGTNKYTVASGQSVTFDFRVKEMWVTGSTFCVAAGLTGIPTASIPTLTGSYPWSASDPYYTGSNAYVNILTYAGLG